MSNYSKLKKYKSLLKKGHIKPHFISQQNILEDIDKDFNLSRITNFKHNFDLFLFKLLNYISSLMFKGKHLSTIHYWIPLSNSKSIIDPRSKFFLKSKSFNNQINLVRTKSLVSSLFHLFTLPNVIFLNGFQRINSFKEIKKLNNHKNKCLFYEKNERVLSKNLKNFLQKNKIKKLFSIDDYRVIQTFLDASYELKIKTIAYQHGRFNKFQLSLKGRTFDEFIVWSKFFKKKLIKVNKEYNKKKITVNNFRFKKFEINKKFNNILYLCEQKVPINLTINDIKKLCKIVPNKKIFIRLRERLTYPKDFLNFLNSKKIIILRESSLSEGIFKNKIKYLIAYYSTALLEVSLYNVYPLMITKNKFFLNEYLEEKLVFELPKLEKFQICENYFNSQNGKFRLKQIRKKLWY